MGKFKYEDYRQPWETGPHWELKREFIEKYSDMFEEDRLLCLAQAYSNVILMNCRYPDPVMQQISHLSKPLQMRKRFQESDCSAGKETSSSQQSNNQQQRVSEKMKSIYEQSGRPFKQIKFCASEDQSNTIVSSEFTNLNQNSPKQSEDMHLPMYNQQITELPESTVTSVTQTVTKTAKSDFPINKNILMEEDKEDEIVATLGIEFIRNMAHTARQFQTKLNSPSEIISNTANKLKITDRLSFKIDLDPDLPKHAPLYCSKVIIDHCVISSGLGKNKKAAKVSSAENAINNLIKLSNSSVTVKGIDRTKSQITSVENFTHTNQTITDDMKILQMFSYNIINRNKEEPDIISLENIAINLAMENYITFDITSESKSSQLTEYTCKFFLKDILISCGKAFNENAAKDLAVENGFMKLSNLSDYEIQNGELKELYCTIVNESSKSLTSISSITDSNIEANNFEKQPFILNKNMFDLSIKDGFVLIVKEAFRKDIQKNVRTVLSESAGFCHKKFEYEFEDVTEPPSKKAFLLIGGEVVGTGISFSKDEAKAIACSRAFDHLRKKYYTLKIKNEYLEGYIITRSQVFDGESFASNALAESNIGCKMLKSMGWTGGGLGSFGISEPVEAQAHHSFGAGLGFGKEKNDLRLFKKRLDAMLQEFSKSGSFSDLVFSKEFTKDERKEIHKIAAKYSLHTQSRGTDENRFLTVRHKYDASKLLMYLVSNGGSNSKFELIDESETSI